MAKLGAKLRQTVIYTAVYCEGPTLHWANFSKKADAEAYLEAVNLSTRETSVGRVHVHRHLEEVTDAA